MISPDKSSLLMEAVEAMVWIRSTFPKFVTPTKANFPLNLASGSSGFFPFLELYLTFPQDPLHLVIHDMYFEKLPLNLSGLEWGRPHFRSHI